MAYNRYRSHRSSKTKSKPKKSLVYALLMMIITAVSVVTICKNQPTVPTTIPPIPDNLESISDISVHFIDVGQGDCSLIQSDGFNILIDAGENDKGEIVSQYLIDHNVTKIDMLIATHPHSDHMGGLDVIVDSFPVDKVILQQLPDNLVPTTKTYTDFLAAVKKKNLKLTLANVGDSYQFGKGALTIIGPITDFEDINDTSVVVRFDYGNSSFMFTGDMEKPAEAALLSSNDNLSCDVLKVGHHGSKTSTTAAFLKAVNPQIAVIGVGDKNSYNHPHESVMSRFQKAGIDVYRTDHNGNIILHIADGKFAALCSEQDGSTIDRAS